ncbi:GATA transcription factor 1-like [Apium graveolens]|uniref:GATA transcription factor 1-like n=1 Tax=Apium graveolens TaxID=4045 RepID=UPI003D78D052
MESLDDLLNFSDDEEKTKLPFSSSSLISINGHKDDDPLPVPEFEEEELEWLSNKDAFPSLETCMDVISDQRGIFPNDQNHLSPISVLENSGRSYIGNLMTPISFPVRGRSKGLRKRRRRFPELCVQQGWQWNKASMENPKQEQEKSLFVSKKVSRGAEIGRRCQHCQTDHTPLWRAGPMGPKTLCNACGVRYRSGRLVPEYRPANSPTFSSKVHSNSHKKIMEKRRRIQTGEMMLDGVCGYRLDRGE